MKKISFYFIVLLMILSFSELKAQTLKEAPVADTKSSLEKDALKARERKNQVTQAKKNQALAKSTIMVNPLDENDIYMGRKAEFLGNLTVSELPADFPKYDKSYGLKYYNNLVDNFYGAHRNILKPSVRQKIDLSFPSGNNDSFNTK